MSTFEKPKRVEVEWLDSMGTQRWMPVESHAEQELLLIRTMGYVARDDDKVLVIVSSLSEYDGAADSTVIPKSCIKRIRRMK